MCGERGMRVVAAASQQRFLGAAVVGLDVIQTSGGT
jgi:hypothetical protein